MVKPLLFVMDTEPERRERLRHTAENIGFDVRPFSDVNYCKNSLEFNSPDFIILNLRLSDRSGYDFLHSLTAKSCPAHILLINEEGCDALLGLEMAVSDRKLNIVGIFSKPIRYDLLVTVLTQLYDYQRLIFERDWQSPSPLFKSSGFHS